MPTGLQPLLQSFDSSVLGASAKGQKTMPGTAKPTGDAKSDQLAEFMEIMSALLALPPEQWKQSLAGLDPLSSDGAAAALPCLIENNEQNAPPAELLTLIMNMRGAVLEQFKSAETEGKQHPLLDMAKALMDDPQMAVLSSLEADKETLKAELVQGDNPEAAFSQAENAVVEDGLEIDLGSNGEGRPLPVMDQGTEKSESPVAVEVTIEGENKPPVALEKETSKGSRHPDQANDFLFKTSDAQADDTPNPSPEKVKSPLAEAVTKTPAGNSLPDEKSRAVDKERQTLAAEKVKNAGSDVQIQRDGENLEERLVQRPVFSNSGHQGLVGRPETGQESKGITLSGDKEVATPQDRAAASDVIRQIVQRMSLHTNGAQSKMVIRLKPEFLGNVHMHVLTENHQVTVRMMADSTLVKDIIEQNIQHLRTELQHHGLEIQKFDVLVSNDEQGWRGGQEQAGYGNTQNQKQSRSGGGKSRHQRGKIMFDTGNEKKIVQKEPGEINYFA